MSNAEKMMSEHDTRPDGVYLVSVFYKNMHITHEIFSTSSKAREWMNMLPMDYKCLCAPFIIDHPTYENVDREGMQ